MDCPDCDGFGFTTGTGHHPSCPGDGQFCMSHCPVPVQEWCDTCGGTGKLRRPTEREDYMVDNQSEVIALEVQVSELGLENVRLVHEASLLVPDVEVPF